MTRLKALTTIFDLAKSSAEAQNETDKLIADVTGFFFESKDFLDFRAAVDFLYGEVSTLHATFGWKGFKAEVLREIKSLKIQSRPPSKDDVAAFYQRLIDIPCETISVFREISGVSIGTLAPLDLAGFRIYRRELHHETLASDSHAQYGLFTDTGEYFIRVIVSSRDTDFAIELADEQFLRFDLVIAFICGYQNQNHNVNASMPDRPIRLKSYIASTTGAAQVVKRLTSGTAIRMDSENITKIDGNERIWEIVSSPAPTKMEARILLAIEWLGQARREMSQANAILKAAISTEILFNLRKEPMGPSISGQIAETMAHVVGTNVEDKLWTEKEMKRLYGIRSNVTHRGAVALKEHDVYLLMALASEAIMILLTQLPYKGFVNEDQFIDHLNIVKYSMPASPPTDLASA